MAEETYELIVVGAGQGGDPLTRSFAKAGKKAALIERLAVGGTCVNRGCTPTKTMAASARVAYLARRGADYGIQTGPVTVDMAKIRDRKRGIVDEFREGTEKKIEAIDGLTLIYGDAKFTGPKTVEVAPNGGGDTRTLTAPLIVINTGARATVPKIEGLDSVPFLDSTSIMEVSEVPAHLVVLGGSYIALEFGQMFRRFGSEVTILEKSEQLLGHEDPDVAEEMQKILTEDGLQIYTGINAKRVAKSADGGVTVTLEDGTEVTGSHLFLAVGRTPNSDGLGLDAAGVEMDDKGIITVSDTLETSQPGVYVIGDIKGGPQFTHISYDDFRILEANLLKDGHRTIKDRQVPYTVFTDPQLGRVGMTETEAKAAGKNIKVATLPMTEAARALETAETRGLMKAVVDADSGQILGAAIIGTEGGETMAVLEVAMIGRLPYTALRDATLAHPTWAESLNNLFMTLDE